MSAERKCGTCHLWGANFYPKDWPVNTTCCADVVMDLPASFIPSRQTMTADQGEGCICWQLAEGARPVVTVDLTKGVTHG